MKSTAPSTATGDAHQDRQRQSPRFVEGREGQEDEHQRQQVDQPARLRGVGFLIGGAAPRRADVVGQHLAGRTGDLLHDGRGRGARRGRHREGDRAVEVELRYVFHAHRVDDLHERRYGHALARGRGDVVIVERAFVEAVFGSRLNIGLVELAKTREVVDVGASQQGSSGRRTARPGRRLRRAPAPVDAQAALGHPGVELRGHRGDRGLFAQRIHQPSGLGEQVGRAASFEILHLDRYALR